eukprot:COSAG02_NODE_1222_length_13800_cov_66.755565_12_plen_64_part_00
MAHLAVARLCWRVASLQHSLHSTSWKCEGQRCFHHWWVRQRQHYEMWLNGSVIATACTCSSFG